MIYIRIELWPLGFKEHAKLLGEARIWNDGKGTLTKGNYGYEIKGRAAQTIRRGNLTDFPRTQLLVWDLLYRALHKAFGDRNSGQAKLPLDIDEAEK